MYRINSVLRERGCLYQGNVVLVRLISSYESGEFLLFSHFEGASPALSEDVAMRTSRPRRRFWRIRLAELGAFQMRTFS